MHPFRESGGEEPLSGITVVDLTQMIAGPFASMILGDLGADVIKIENPNGGDALRHHQPHPENFDLVNRNKRGISVNLKSEAGQEVVHELIKDADVFIENVKPGRADAFNLSYDDLSSINPGLIYCSVSGFGTDSPYEHVPAWDILMQAMSGFMSMTGEPDGPPMWSGLSSGDISAAMYSVISILSALYAREIGVIEGEQIEISMLDTTLSWNTRMGYTFANDEPFPRPGNTHPAMAPFGEFKCEDESIFVGASTKGLWKGFCQALGRDDLIDDERFDSMTKRVKNREQLHDEVNPLFASESAEYWVSQMHETETPAAPVYDTKSLLEDDHVKERELHQKIEREDGPDAEVIRSPLYFQNLDTEVRSSPPMLGEDTVDVLEQFGYTEEEIGRLITDDVVTSDEVGHN